MSPNPDKIMRMVPAVCFPLAAVLIFFLGQCSYDDGRRDGMNIGFVSGYNAAQQVSLVRWGAYEPEVLDEVMQSVDAFCSPDQQAFFHEIILRTKEASHERRNND